MRESIQVHSIGTDLSIAYLIAAEGGMILVDGGSPGNEQKILGKMHSLEREDLKLIYITHGHFDHYGSIAALRKLTGAPVAIHSADAGAMARGQTPIGSAKGWGTVVQHFVPLAERFWQPTPTPPDILLQDEEDLSEYGVPAVSFHTPGHTPGSSSLLVDDRLAFVGDLLSSRGGPHLQRYFATNWDLLPASLARLQEINPEWLYTGHGRKPMRGELLSEL
jgi:glyoxylase-like metal-dependent hydrolase (beta-lactamase superfamily II)